MKIAVFPGSFDPITKGHVNLVKRAIPLFDKIVIGIGVNSSKKYIFPLDKRKELLTKVFKDDASVVIDHFDGLTVTFCKKYNSKYLLRGLRNASDFDYEKTIAQLNNIIGDDIETVFLISKPEFSHISSSIVREILRAKGDVTPFVPSEIAEDLKI